MGLYVRVCVYKYVCMYIMFGLCLFDFWCVNIKMMAC